VKSLSAQKSIYIPKRTKKKQENRNAKDEGVERYEKEARKKRERNEKETRKDIRRNFLASLENAWGTSWK
jgi:hypothetical protein